MRTAVQHDTLSDSGGGVILVSCREKIRDADRGERESAEAGGPLPRVLSVPVPADATGRTDVWLTAQLPEFSRARLQALIREGRVTCRGVAVKANASPQPGSVIEICLPAPVAAEPAPEAIPLDTVYEDRDCLVINKPAGLVVHPAPGHAAGTLVNALLHHCRDLVGVGGVQRPGIVHRLDKDTSGLMVVAKHDAAMAGLVRLFQTGEIRKEYLTLIHGTPPQVSGTLRTRIGRHPVHRKKMAVVETGGKEAVTHYTVEKRLGGLSLVRCRIETGRTHQIRVHMLSLGCPVAGDALYGKSAEDKRLPHVPPRQLLHAARLAFAHPLTGVELDFAAPLPADFLPFLEESEGLRIFV